MGKARMIKCKLYSYRVFWDPETGECGKLNNVHPPAPTNVILIPRPMNMLIYMAKGTLRLQ